MKRRLFLQKSILFALAEVTPLVADTKKGKAWNLGHHGNFEFIKLYNNVYLMSGITVGKDREAQCFVHNPIFIESKKGVIVIDPGASYLVGREVLSQIERITLKPIIAIFNTHHHSDHWFANEAIVERYPKVKIYGHKNILLSGKLQYFTRKNKKKNLLKAKRINYPNYFLDDGNKVEIDAEVFEIRHPKLAHTNSDIMIIHKSSNILFLGDIALESSLANFTDGSSILGNIEILKEIIESKKYRFYVPGHGKYGTKKSVVFPYYTYLNIIKDEVKKAHTADVDFFELEECRENIEQRLTWEDNLNFPINFLQNHIDFLYLELD